MRIQVLIIGSVRVLSFTLSDAHTIGKHKSVAARTLSALLEMIALISAAA
jgi:hypothetical protein